jgi:hypothetical protein
MPSNSKSIWKLNSWKASFGAPLWGTASFGQNTKCFNSGRVVGSVTNHPAGYLRYPARWEPLVPEQLESWCCPKYCGGGQSPQLGAFGTRSNNKISSFPRSSAARRESSCPLNQRGTDTRLVYLTKGSTGRLCLPVGGKAPNCRRTQHLILF